MSHTPCIVFHSSHNDQSKEEMTARGYVSHVFVVTEGERYFPVFFYDPVRLGQDLAAGAARGQPYVAEPGMIVVPEVSLEAMTNAVEALHAEGYFDCLLPVPPPGAMETTSPG